LAIIISKSEDLGEDRGQGTGDVGAFVIEGD